MRPSQTIEPLEDKNSFAAAKFALDTVVIQAYTLCVAKKQQQEMPKLRAWRPTVDDAKIMRDLQAKLGVNEPALLRMGLRKLAEAEGLR